MSAPFQLAFVPLPGNRTFNDGYGMSIEYRFLETIDFTLDFRRLELNFSMHRISLIGRNLHPLFDLIRSHSIDRIDQVEPDDLESALTFRVTGMGRNLI